MAAIQICMLSFVMLLPLGLSMFIRSPPVVTSIVAHCFDLLLHKLFSSCDKCAELLLHSLCNCLIDSVRHVCFDATVYAIQIWLMEDCQIVAATLTRRLGQAGSGALNFVAASGQLLHKVSGELVLNVC